MWSVIFGFLAAMMTALLLAGLVRPAWLRNAKTGEIPKRSEIAGGSIFLMILFAGLAAFLAPDAKTEARSGPDGERLAAAQAGSDSPKSSLTNETKALWNQLISTTSSCDEAAKTVASSVQKKFDVYELYRQAKDASQLCGEAASSVQALDPPPSADGAIADAFDEAIDRCSDSYTIKGSAYQKMLVVLDGDMRPSAVSDLEDSMKAANSLSLGCAAGMMQAAAKGDVPLSAFES
jgi:hypothetical protein